MPSETPEEVGHKGVSTPATALCAYGHHNRPPVNHHREALRAKPQRQDPPVAQERHLCTRLRAQLGWRLQAAFFWRRRRRCPRAARRCRGGRLAARSSRSRWGRRRRLRLTSPQKLHLLPVRPQSSSLPFLPCARRRHRPLRAHDAGSGRSNQDAPMQLSTRRQCDLSGPGERLCETRNRAGARAGEVFHRGQQNDAHARAAYLGVLCVSSEAQAATCRVKAPPQGLPFGPCMRRAARKEDMSGARIAEACIPRTSNV